MLERKTIWVLQGARAGDNAQARELASLLDADAVTRELTFNALHHVPNVFLGASVATLTEHSRVLLQPPWPAMVIATGKRSAPVARWIKQQSQGATRLVHLGRPRAPLSAFDLVITTPQYALPAAANVIERNLPFATARDVDVAELGKWRRVWDGLPRPWVGVAVGNAKFPLRFGAKDIEKFASNLNGLAKVINGSLLLMASPRTDHRLIEGIAKMLDVPHRSYGRFDRDNNPYQAALALADRFVVTSDSVSMLSEMMNTGKPVDVFELSTHPLRLQWSAKRGTAAWLSRHGFLQPPRDVSALVRRLIVDGHVGVLGGRQGRGYVKAHEDVVVNRLAAMLKA